MLSAVQTKQEVFQIDGVPYRIESFLDRNQFFDPGGAMEALGISPASWPFFGMVWPSGLLLAELTSLESLKQLRVLEIGCGLGIASLVANAAGADILASDYHPMAAQLMACNSRHNGLSDTPFQRIDWRILQAGLGTFDLILGSDLLYEPDHPALLSAFLAAHSHAGTRILIVDPKRRLQNNFLKRMQVLGFTAHSTSSTTKHWQDHGFKGVIQRYSAYKAAALTAALPVPPG